MSTKKDVTIAGISALAVASLIALALLFSGIQLVPTSNLSNSTSSAGSEGILSVLITDPPHVPVGVSAVYITYSNLEIHVADAGNESGWKLVQQQGTIELMGTVNISQTIASVKVPSGKYNLLRFNITSAVVTYNGKNYTAFVPSSELTVPIIGGIEVNSTKPSAALIDISPTVFNIGSSTNPEFIIRPVAKAFPVPASSEITLVGFRMNLVTQLWWKDVQQRYTANLRITDAKLSQDMLSVTVKNVGNESTNIYLVIVSPLASVLHGNVARPTHIIPPFLMSAVFIVTNNGTLIPLVLPSPVMAGTFQPQYRAVFIGIGYALNPNATKTFTYNGEIVISFGRLPGPQAPNALIVPGQQYLITVIGTEAVAGYVVVAS